MSPEGSMSNENQPQFDVIGICFYCEHRQDPFRCNAFPEGIPSEILVGEFLHTEPYPGDNGIRFKDTREVTP